MSVEDQRCRNCGGLFERHHGDDAHCWNARYEWDTDRLSNTRWLGSADGAAACAACQLVRNELRIMQLGDGSNGYDPLLPKVCWQHDVGPQRGVRIGGEIDMSAFESLSQQMRALSEAFEQVGGQVAAEQRRVGQRPPAPATTASGQVGPAIERAMQEPVPDLTRRETLLSERDRLRVLLTYDRRLCLNCCFPLIDHGGGGRASCLSMKAEWLPSLEGARDLQ